MAKQGLRWLVPQSSSSFQLLVCLAMIGAGFNFDDLKSTVVFLYAYHYIMMALKAFFRLFIHQDRDEDVCLAIGIFNAVTQVVLQFWGFSAVSRFTWQNNNSCENTPTVISAIIIVGIELVLVVIMLVNIYKQLAPRISKCLSKKRPQSDEMKPTNSRTPRDNNEPSEDKDALLTSTNQNTTDTENEIDPKIY